MPKKLRIKSFKWKTLYDDHRCFHVSPLVPRKMPKDTIKKIVKYQQSQYRARCENTLVTPWKWSWRYMEWRKLSIGNTVWDATRNPFKVWRDI